MTAIRLLHRLEPERAHEWALCLAPFLPPRAIVRSERLHTRLGPLALPHPLCLAAGLDKDARIFGAMLRQGFAAVEVGTVTPRPQQGNPRPRLFRLAKDRAIVNRMGFNNAGLDAMVRRLAARRPGAGIVGANIGMNKDAADPVADYVAGLVALHPLVDYLTVNVSSPNTPGLRDLQQEAQLRRLLDALLAARAALPTPHRPLFLKIAPDLDQAAEAAIAEVALAVRLDGLIVANTTIARPASLLSPERSEAGGLSGPPLLAPSTALLARMARRLRGAVPLIGVGGIASGADAYAKIRAGAAAVQIYTALVYEGPALIGRILAELDALLARDGFARLEDAIGVDVEAQAAS